MSVDYTFTPGTAPIDPGSSRKHKPKVLMAEFGDGFSQRAAQGPNNDPLNRTFSFTNVTQAEKDYIDGFFTDRGGVESFYFWDRDEPQPRAYICPEWEVIDVRFDVYTVNATFQQVYDI